MGSVRDAAAGVYVSQNQARANRVHAYAFSGDLLGQSNSEAVNRTFAGGVVDILAGCAHFGGGAAEVDDAATRAAMHGAHAQDGLLGAGERAQDIDAHDAL